MIVFNYLFIYDPRRKIKIKQGILPSFFSRQGILLFIACHLGYNLPAHMMCNRNDGITSTHIGYHYPVRPPWHRHGRAARFASR
jgi:hypothetical protein